MESVYEINLCLQDTNILQTCNELRTNNTITSLIICKCISNSEYFNIVCEILAKNKNIKKLCIDQLDPCGGNGYHGRNIKLLYVSAAMNDSITNFNDCCEDVSNNKFFKNYLRNTITLKKLSVSVNENTKFCKMMANIKNNTTLETLIIDGYTNMVVDFDFIDPLTDNDMNQILDSIKSVSTLKKLCLIYYFDDRQMDKIYDYLKTATNIECFGLHINYISDAKLLELIDCLRENPNLVEVEFYGDVCSKKIQYIAQIISHGKLHRLKISQVYNIDFTILSRALKNNNRLEHLKLKSVIIENPVEISRYVLNESNISALTIKLIESTNIYPTFRIFGKKSTLTKFNLSIFTEERICPNLIIALMEKLKSNASTTIMKITATYLPIYIEHNHEKKALVDFLINNHIVQQFTLKCDGDIKFFNSLSTDPQLESYDIKYYPSSKYLMVKRKGHVFNGTKRAIMK